jgi:chorismate mutase
MAYLVGRSDALRTISEYVEQLIDEIHSARCELASARAEHAAKIAQTKAHFDKEAADMRRELTETITELHQLRLSMFSSWRRHEGDRLQ